MIPFDWIGTPASLVRRAQLVLALRLQALHHDADAVAELHRLAGTDARAAAALRDVARHPLMGAGT